MLSKVSHFALLRKLEIESKLDESHFQNHIFLSRTSIYQSSLLIYNFCIFYGGINTNTPKPPVQTVPFDPYDSVLKGHTCASHSQYPIQPNMIKEILIINTRYYASHPFVLSDFYKVKIVYSRYSNTV